MNYFLLQHLIVHRLQLSLMKRGKYDRHARIRVFFLKRSQSFNMADTLKIRIAVIEAITKRYGE